MNKIEKKKCIYCNKLFYRRVKAGTMRGQKYSYLRSPTAITCNKSCASKLWSRKRKNRNI